MTTMTRVTMTPIDASYASAVGGQAPGVIVTPSSGDFVPISSGRGTLISFQTTGIGNTVVLTNQVALAYGTGGNITITLAATDFQQVFIGNDGTDRFDTGVGTANAGLITMTFAPSPATGLTIRAVTIP
jgi:hypothetical protein